MWAKVTTDSRLLQQGRKVGSWRAILDLAEPLLETLGPRAGMYSQTELVESVRHLPPVQYKASIEETQDEAHLQDAHLVFGTTFAHDDAEQDHQPRRCL